MRHHHLAVVSLVLTTALAGTAPAADTTTTSRPTGQQHWITLITHDLRLTANADRVLALH